MHRVLNLSRGTRRPDRHRGGRARRPAPFVLVTVALALVVGVAAPAVAADAPGATPVPATTFGGAAKVPASAFSQAAHAGRVPVIVSLAQGAASLADGNGLSAARVQVAQQVGDHLSASLPKGSARGTRNLTHLGMITTTVDAKGLAALATSPDVASVAVSQWRKPDLAPEENAIDAPFAWNLAPGFNGTGEAVGILDTGVQPDHPFFGGRVIDGACFTAAGENGIANVVAICPGADPTTAPSTARTATSVAGSSADSVPCTGVPGECLHGTHVAGIAAGGSGSTSGNGSGVAWGANIVAVQVFTTLTSSTYCGAGQPPPCIEAADVDVAAGLNWLLGRRAADHIVAANMSLGSSNAPTACDSDPDDAIYHSAFASAVAAGVAPVVAAGNSYGPSSGPDSYPNGLSFPACDSRAVSVGAVTDSGQWVQGGTCPFTGLSPCSFSQDSPQLSMVAPGWNVSSSVPGGTTPPGSFASLYGTSMATPFVTGAFAVIRQEHPTWGVADVESLLRGTGLPIRDTRPGTLGEATPMLNLGGAVNPPTFHAVTPARLLDTRDSTGLPNSATRLGAGSEINIRVTNYAGVPATGVSAVVINVTAVNPVGNGFVTAWPSGMPEPFTSNLNLTPGVVKPNLVTVKVGADGEVSLINQTGSVDLVVDIDGWYDAGGSQTAGGGTLHAITPQRVLDTRDGTGLPGHGAAKVGAGQIVHLNVASQAGLPAGAKAVVLNLTSVNTTVLTFVTAWPSNAGEPVASSLNPEAGQVDSNLVVVPIGPDGVVNLINALGSVDLVADLAGWFDSTPTTATGHLVPLSPARLLDTRDGTGAPGARPIGPFGSITLQVTGRGGVPSSGVSAVVVNLTAVNNTASTFVTAWPTGVSQPNASNLNPIVGRITSNLVTVKVGSNGQINLFNLNGSTDVVADVFGWYSG